MTSFSGVQAAGGVLTSWAAAHGSRDLQTAVGREVKQPLSKYDNFWFTGRYCQIFFERKTQGKNVDFAKFLFCPCLCLQSKSKSSCRKAGACILNKNYNILVKYQSIKLRLGLCDITQISAI